MRAQQVPSANPLLSLGTGDRGAEPHFGEIWAMLRRRWLLIAGSTLFCFVVAGLFVAYRPPVFEATLSLRVDHKPLQVPTLDATRLAMGWPMDAEIDTEMEMLRSRALAEGVIDSLALRFQLVAPARVPRTELVSEIRVARNAPAGRYRLEQQPNRRYVVRDRRTGELLGEVGEGVPVVFPGASLLLSPAALQHPVLDFDIVTYDDAVKEFHTNLQVRRPNAGATIVTVRYRGADPGIVRDVPNILAAQLIAERRVVRQTETRSTAQFLREQIAKLSEELEAAENSLRDFREAEEVVSLTEQANSAISQSAELQARRSALDAERSALAQLLASMAGTPARAGGTQPYRDLVAFPSLLSNVAVSGLLTSLANVEDRRTELLSRRRPSDPEVQILTDRILQLEAQLHSVATTYLDGLTNQVQALDATLARFGAQMARIPARELEMARLDRDAKALQEIVVLLTSRLKEAEIAEAVEDPSVRVVDRAILPSRPARQGKSLLLAAALCAGLLFGVAAAFVREYTDSTVHTRGDTQIATGVPVLGLIPAIVPALEGERRKVRRFPARRKQLDAPPADERCGIELALASDAYDRLHSNLLFAQPGSEPKTLLVTSPLPGDGKTTTATNLAITLAQRGLRVLLIDTDLRRGLVHRVIKAPRGQGLAEVLVSSASVPEALRVIEAGSGVELHVLTAGETPPNPAQLLGSSRMQELLRSLASHYDRIVLDSAPVNLVADAILLAPHVDSILLVARAGITPFEALAYAAEQFRTINHSITGAVLNDIDFERDVSYDPAYRWTGYSGRYYSGAGA